jgi:hypothetical protein
MPFDVIENSVFRESITRNSAKEAASTVILEERVTNPSKLR